MAKGGRTGISVKIQNNASVYEGVVLEDDVLCSPSMVFTRVVNSRSHISRRDDFRPTLVRWGAPIGVNAPGGVQRHGGVLSLLGSLQPPAGPSPTPYEIYERNVLAFVEYVLSKGKGVVFASQLYLGNPAHLDQQTRIREALKPYLSNPRFRYRPTHL